MVFGSLFRGGDSTSKTYQTITTDNRNFNIEEFDGSGNQFVGDFSGDLTITDGGAIEGALELAKNAQKSADKSVAGAQTVSINASRDVSAFANKALVAVDTASRSEESGIIRQGITAIAIVGGLWVVARVLMK